MNSSTLHSAAVGKTPRLLLAAAGLALIGWVLSGDVRVAGGPGIGATETAVLGLGAFNLLSAVFLSRWVPALLLLQGSLALTFVLAETVLRLTFAPRYFTPYQLNDRYLYDLIPDSVREHRILPENGGSNIYRVNSRGFRGEEFAAEPGEATRVVIYGDSFIHAEYTPLENTLAVQLEQQLAERLGQPVEVINAGISGYAPDQALRRIEDQLPWLQPDIIVLGVFTGNDYGDLLRNKIYRLGDDGELIENDYSFSDDILLNARLDRAEFITKRIAREAAFALFPSLGAGRIPPFDPVAYIDSALQQHLNEYQELVVNGDMVIRELRSDPYSADISVMPDSESARYKTELMAAVVARIADVAEAAGVPLLVVGIPHPMDVLQGSHSSGQIDPAKYPDYDAEKLTGALQAIAEANDLPQLNLLQPFRSVPDPAELYLKLGDDHWNTAGQRYAAELIAAKLIGEGMTSARRAGELTPAQPD